MSRKWMLGVLAAAALGTLSGCVATREDDALQMSHDEAQELAPVRMVRKSVPARSHDECLADSQGIEDLQYKRCRYGYKMVPATEIASN